MITPDQLAASGSEHAIQTALFQQAALEIKNYPQLHWLYAVPNGFFSSAGQKAKMKAEGLSDGVPDIMLPYPKWGEQHYCGLYIEMKREKYRNYEYGGCSVEQQEWLAYLNEAGYKAQVCYGWREAWDCIVNYLGEK